MRYSLIILAMALLSVGARAEQFVTHGDYRIHYNALPTAVLQADVASSYQIQRSRQRGFVNISILKNVMGTSSMPVEGRFSVTATNLNNQQRVIPMRRIQEQGAIYYLGEFRISNEETLQFDVEVLPEFAGEPHRFQFSQQFFVD